MYLSEMAPARLRGALNIMFQLATSIGAPALSNFWVMPSCTCARLICVSYATSLPQAVAVRPQCLLRSIFVRLQAGAKQARELCAQRMRRPAPGSLLFRQARPAALARSVEAPRSRN